MHVQVPEECQHEASNDSLKHELLVEQQGPHQAEHEADRHDDQQESRQDRQQGNQRHQPQRHAGMGRGEIAGAALAAAFGISRIDMVVRTELDAVGPAAEVAVERLSDREAMAIVAVAHIGSLEQRLALIAGRPEPNR